MLPNGAGPNSITPQTHQSPTATSSSPNYFTYDRKTFLLLDDQINVKSIIRDVCRVPEYKLRERTDACDSSSVKLGIYLRMLRPGEDFDHGCQQQRKRLVELLFTETDRQCFTQQELEKRSPLSSNEDGSSLSMPQFFDQLRRHHQAKLADDQAKPDTDAITHQFLRPKLRPYQQQAIRWMMNRETIPVSLPAQYVRLQNACLPEMSFFMEFNNEVCDKEPPPIRLPTGGILADEMGMGKTVEMLGLLLLNRRAPKGIKRDVSQTNFTPKNTKNTIKRRKASESNDSEDYAELRCLCLSTGRKNTVECHKCGLLQHRKCVLKHHTPGQGNKLKYMCPECWRTKPLVESGATIIVSPASIKYQWESEIRKHITDPNFRMFVYNGITSGGWISPADLASYDVVLTDYSVLRPEIYFVAENARFSRHEKRFLSPATPLTMVRWWRVCLDEAQMVEGVNTNATKMVKELPAVHRWTVTGTPVEKTIDNLYGLVHFLDYAPYDSLPVWRKYSTLFHSGHAEPLLSAMVRIMWRTCKHAVLDQLGIPPQTERVHYITMSDLQNCFYRAEHMQCAQAFHEKARKISRSLSMAQMNIQTLNKLMEPLRKLRQDCSIPSVIYGRNALPTKKLLTPTELHSHLVTSNVNECKSQLRTVVSSLNGMAAIHILERNYDQALRLYQASLRWADDYKGSISVDSLLQIHALHNMLDVVGSFASTLDEARMPTEAELKEYRERCAALEWRYIEVYANKVRSIENTLHPAIEKVEELVNPRGKHSNDTTGILVRANGSWWRELFHSFESNDHHTAFLYRLLRGEHSMASTDVRSWRGMDLWLTIWLDKVTGRRNALKKGFHSIKFFVDNLKPNHLWAPNMHAIIESFIRTAFACHLDPALFHVDENGVRTEQRVSSTNQHSPASPCMMCKVKEKLTALEEVLFLLKQTKVTTGGLWQMSLQEQILKQIHQYASKHQESLNREILAEGEQWLLYLERLKLEFKEYSQYWVEINYTVAAYDELAMCKSRLQLLSDAEHEQMRKEKKSPTIMQLLKSELPAMLQEQQEAKVSAERAFVRLKGTLKYLEHLSMSKEIDPCPICHVTPDSKYAVLQCGHHFCSICAIRLLKLAAANFNVTSCVVCRHQQHVKTIQYVTLVTTAQTMVRGSYSNKIFKIVETVLELKAHEPDVKIVIFSHWEPILSQIGVALRENDIVYREKSAKFFNIIAEFKDFTQGVTCLLLPLRYGSKGLNLTEATHVFLVEPILNPGEELQAVGRVHRIGQTRPTFVHRFIMNDTIEETIHETIQKDRTGRWLSKDVSVEQLEQLFQLNDTNDTLVIV
ncbi:E3 ubiquitin-protein ligase SHPRH [Anopheles nili]|uniref:E3 ubiquitin-protein ligase SHPRH n=1 Tax=Anopheles nili TaxID=185578 RepID=UPI00237B9BCE|nr:E3 ubiquitin-protein ligase SHPRH [Anopheles nili]